MRCQCWVAAIAVATFTLGAGDAEADAPTEVVAPASSGQQAVAVALTEEGLLAKVCEKAAGCSALAEGAQRYAAKALAGNGSLEIVRLEGGRHVVRAFAFAGGEEYSVFLAAPLAGEAPVPKRLWSGWVGRRSGGPGEARMLTMNREATPRGTRFTFAKQREDNQICGRATTIHAQTIDPSTMSLKPASVVRTLDDAEVAKAPTLQVGLVPEGEGRITPYRLMRARGSGSPGAGSATDGDRATPWSERAPGAGRGEFITMMIDARVPITALDLTLVPVIPGSAASPEQTVPSSLVLVTDQGLMRLEIPAAAREQHDAVYRATFDPPLRSACLSVVLDGAHVPPGLPAAHMSSPTTAPHVSIVELAARTELDDKTPVELVKLLDGASSVANQAGALLLSTDVGADAAMAGYDGLGQPGRERARGVIDAVDCKRKADFYRRLLGRTNDDNERRVAEDRVRRCSRTEGPEGLRTAVQAAQGEEQKRLVRELAMLYPEASVPVLLELLTGADDAMRRVYRQFLAGVANKRKSRPAFAEKLETTAYRALPLVARIDLLRALGAALPETPGGPAAFASLVAEPPEFRTRYLLLGPAAELARVGDAPAQTFLRRSLTEDERAPIRAEAARVAATVPALTPDLVKAAADPAVRVREAALRALAPKDARPAPPGLVGVASSRLEDDPWTFVRTSAVNALRSVSDDRSVDARLAKAVTDDRSPDVRRAAVRSLGQRGAQAFKHVIQARVDAKMESPAVRAEAVLALGRLCDRDHLDEWTELAEHAAFPMSEGERAMGLAALTSLGRVHPENLEERLGTLLGPKVPRDVREGARQALAMEPACR